MATSFVTFQPSAHMRPRKIVPVPGYAAPPKHREPDQAILEHESKRKVEVKCLELQLELEDNGDDEDKIEEKPALAPSAKSLKLSDTHGLALAKKAELSKMARAFGTRSDYQEGEAFDREKQEEIKIRKMAEREERDRKKEEDRIKYQEQKAKWEAEKREKDRLRRREEDKLRREGNDSRRKDRMPPPPKGEKGNDPEILATAMPAQSGIDEAEAGVPLAIVMPLHHGTEFVPAHHPLPRLLHLALGGVMILVPAPHLARYLLRALGHLLHAATAAVLAVQALLRGVTVLLPLHHPTASENARLPHLSINAVDAHVQGRDRLVAHPCVIDLQTLVGAVGPGL
ncbi:hypothetical protein FPV67DRAFT_1649132 [Lyophyllum atratum]|nr:hypothetical protein FPV67DRAFT_1649132 [Lyophyllum atratum]